MKRVVLRSCPSNLTDSEHLAKKSGKTFPSNFFTGVCRLSLYPFNDVQIKFRLLFAYKHRSVHIHVDEHSKHVTQAQTYLLDAKEQTSFRLNCFYDN